MVPTTQSRWKIVPVMWVQKLAIDQSFVNSGFNHCPLSDYYYLMSLFICFSLNMN